ncbi:29150_t:CDS:2, partial [Gigaspora margarita]
QKVNLNYATPLLEGPHNQCSCDHCSCIDVEVSYLNQFFDEAFIFILTIDLYDDSFHLPVFHIVNGNNIIIGLFIIDLSES